MPGSNLRECIFRARLAAVQVTPLLFDPLDRPQRYARTQRHPLGYSSPSNTSGSQSGLVRSRSRANYARLEVYFLPGKSRVLKVVAHADALID